MSSCPELANTEEIAAAIRTGTDHDRIRSQVANIVRGISAMRRKQVMIMHPLGFLCIPIHRSDQFGLCVHVWMEGVRSARPTTSTIHLHTWDLFSYVLCGAVQNQRVEVLPNRTRPTHRVFEIFSKDGIDEIRPTEELVTYQVTGVQSFNMGDRYFVYPRDYHQTSVIDRGFTATIMLAENWGSSPQLSLGKLSTERHDVRRRWSIPDEAKKVTDKLLDRIC